MGYFFYSAPTDRTNRVGDLARESHGVLQVIQRHQAPEGGSSILIARACPLGTCPLPSRIQIHSNYALLTDRYMCAVLCYIAYFVLPMFPCPPFTEDAR